MSGAAVAAGAERTAQAESFRRSREARGSALAQDYCELIADLLEETGQARAVDIARRLGVAHPTVVKAIGRLKRDGLVRAEPYRSIFLTEEGQRQAIAARRRHQIVLRFLAAIGVSDASARRDAEGIEHHVSEETLQAMARFVEGRG
ncbi:MAG TPA: manganese-binding transcriptional regulator MntR [Acetobacteraceae bacterium]|nr:manganese-binding transcriptional regulator MntR [Acetobacteraceae bacterium]